MEDEKKKKRNKKKKKQQTKPAAESVTTSTDLNHVDGDTRIAQNDIVPVSDHSQAAETDAEKDKSLIDESSVEDKIKLLQEQTASCMPKEAVLEETIKQLRDENDSHLQKEAVLEETIRRLKSENEAHMQKEFSLENKMKQLLDEISTFTQKEVSFEETLRHLEQDRGSWLVMERSSKETISSLNDEITRLREQVLDLEESRSNLLVQNNSLMGTVTNLQDQIQNYERNVPLANTQDELKKNASEEELNSQIEAACTLVEKLITENAELVEKVNELCIKLNQQRTLHRVSSSDGSDSLPVATETTKVREDRFSASSTQGSLPVKPECLEEIPIHDEAIHSRSNGDNTQVEPAMVNTKSPLDETEETVPVSMNPEGDVDVEAQVVEQEEPLPITDAPLIGAPFRLVSFVARYVSGADLVENNKTLLSRY
ncbi:PREDICTED: rho-associated protein kinase 2 [Tarenaya hassleriana]|uniref:rho-associated protein kinase 2 n=1 Tax=Tarenaya hassleriana TaxID=28532 RepID=UPI00053C6555|nr:PREDICTED: rho-associated protein kinase 2 [Tarenaya hassleriana]XP_019058290.1 PREDICTED: rho-associated protein kinase 2 [Tarenaya hassleriana]XP_019058291.1 PREDICTED: rho-associated protein kinase 2 [Tarenaya hassleriana]